MNLNIIWPHFFVAVLSVVVGVLTTANSIRVTMVRGRWQPQVAVFTLVAMLISATWTAIPCQAALPTLEPLADVTLLSGSALHIPLLGSDADGHPLLFSATSDDPLVSLSVPQGNRSMRITSNGFGEMVFELFESRASRVTEQIIELASSGDYNGVPFHRVINSFMIQTGDITNGNGTGGSRLGNFDDQFHVDLQHNRSGVLSMAKSGDDTNDSQFFITEVPTRHLDFNHSIFGQLVEGEAVREAISNVPTGAGDKPITDVFMDSVEIFTDIENAVLMLSAPEGTSGSAEVTVTVSDGVESFDQVFNVTVTPDLINGGPFLRDLDSSIFVIEQGISSTLQLEAVDVEDDSVVFAQNSTQVPVGTTATTDAETGLVTITPAADYSGIFNLLVGVRAENGSNTGDTWDTQIIPVLVLPETLLADFDLDTDVDGGDFLIWQQGFATGNTHFQGDATGDGTVDEADLAVWLSNFGTVAPLSTIVSIPEPSTLGMALLGGFLLLRRKRSQPRMVRA
ncbi:MAG: peptidylprolyl isomerase [Pirellulales bacterium]